jgi:hypothetical protein
MSRWCGQWAAACGRVAALASLGCTTGDGGAGYRLAAQTGVLRAVTATDTGFVAVGYDSQDALMLTSADAVTWTRETLPALANLSLSGEGSLFDVAAGNGIVVAVGSDAAGNGFLARRSPEGEWSVERTTGSYSHVIFGNGVFVSYGVVLANAASRDGLTWTPTSGGSSVAFDGENFVALDPLLPTTPAGGPLLLSDHYTTSADGFAWSDPQPTPHGLSRWDALARVGPQILGFAGSNDPLLHEAQVVGVAGQSLADLEMTKTSLADGGMSGIASDGARFVVAGSIPTLWTTSLPIGSSPWTSFDAGGRGFAIFGVAFGGGSYVAVGLRSSATTPFPAVLTSTDGITWKD